MIPLWDQNSWDAYLICLNLFFFPWKCLFLLLLGVWECAFFGVPLAPLEGPGSLLASQAQFLTPTLGWARDLEHEDVRWSSLDLAFASLLLPLWRCFKSLLVSLCPWSVEMTVNFCCHCPTMGKPIRGYRLQLFGLGDWFQHLLLMFRKFRLRRVSPPIHYYLQAVRCTCKRTNISHSQLHKTFIWHHKHEWKMNLHHFCFCLCCLCLQPQKVGYNLRGLFWGLCNFVATIYKLVPLKKRWFMRIWR